MLATLFLSLAGIGMAAVSKPNNMPPDLQKITFVHYAKDSSSKPIWDDTVDIYKFMFGGIKWADTMTYQVNPLNSELTEEEVIGTLKASLKTWDNAITGDFELFGDPIRTELGYNSGDGINRVTWDDLNPGIIAMCSFWFNTRTKEIVESDVVFNTYYDWSTTGGSGKMDLQNIATHEFGHNGLNDLYMPPSQALTMYGYSGFEETDKQTLGTGDISGIQALYGS